MTLPKFSEIISLSNEEIIKKIYETEIEIFNLRFQNSTRQNVNLHKLKHKIHRFAQLKTLFGQRLKKMK